MSDALPPLALLLAVNVLLLQVMRAAHEKAAADLNADLERLERRLAAALAEQEAAYAAADETERRLRELSASFDALEDRHRQAMAWIAHTLERTNHRVR